MRRIADPSEAAPAQSRDGVRTLMSRREIAPFFAFAAACYLVAPYMGLDSFNVDPRIAEVWPPGGVGFVLLPLTHTAVTVGLVACLMGLGNGISSGVVLTLGADAAPVEGRAQFLGGWRLCADLGNALGPLAIGGITAIATLGLATVVMGVVTWLGSGWLARFIPVRSRE